MCGVSVGGNRQIRLSTFFFLSLWMFVLVGFCLIGLWCNKESNTQPGRYTQPCLPCWFFFFFLLNTSFQPSVCFYVCVCVCVCVCGSLPLCKLILYLPHLKSWADKPAWQWEKERNASLACWRANNKWAFVWVHCAEADPVKTAINIS